jgi:glycosidase
MKCFKSLVVYTVLTLLPYYVNAQVKHPKPKMKMEQPSANNKLIIYQLLPRLFGNTNTTNKFYGSIVDNGCGKLNDITNEALSSIKAMGFTHVWYTGVIEHATMTDYTKYGIHHDDPDVVKGRAGSPYAIKDYYDIDPDLAVDVKNRIAEFEQLVQRSHANGLKVLMDFVPNHVARTYVSNSRPQGTRDIGQDDDKTKAFSPANDFYYILNEPFEVPSNYNPGGDEYFNNMKDGHFIEFPAKATGNDVFNARPTINDWFETVKLNYGVDYINGRATHFSPAPPLWQKLFDILNYWSNKGIDGFRCDMVEMVPVEFWSWVIPKLKAEHPQLVFIGEAYDASKYKNYIFTGHFDYLYDKVGLYDGLRRLITNQNNATVWDINHVVFHESNDFPEHMLRFLENHDEQRIASADFAGNPWLALPAMVVSATLSTGPVMVYFGQEVGEPGAGAEGFGGNDGRTSIFDYWGVPEHQKWVNDHHYDGGRLSDSQKQLRSFYSKLLNIAGGNEAITQGKFYELMLANQRPQNGFDNRVYAYLRYTEQKRVLIITNFNRDERKLTVQLPADMIESFKLNGHVTFTDLMSGAQYDAVITDGLSITLPASTGLLLSF